MTATIPELKRKLKRGPKLSRRLLGEFALILANSSARPLRNASPELLAKTKAELVRLASNGDRCSWKYAERMFERYPELRGA